MRTLKTKKLYRTFDLVRETINKDERTIELSFSSEEPVDRWFGTEVLDHSPGAIRLGRLNTGGPLLLDHDPSKQIGVNEKAIVGADRKGRAVVRFGKSPLADEIFSDVLDGIRKNVSVGYVIHEMFPEKKEKEKEFFRATDWEPLEISIVSIPADVSVGVGRAGEETYDTKIKEKENTDMEKAEERKEEKKEEKREERLDVSAERNKAVEAERNRIADIQALAERHPKAKEDGLRFIKEGRSIEEFRALVLEKIGSARPVDTTADIGLSDKEAKRFSIVRAINALANPGQRPAYEAARFEFEASEAVAKKLGRSPQGVFMPREVQMVAQRDLLVGTTTAGGYTMATDLLAANFIELLRNAMKVKELGAWVLDGLIGDVAIPKQTGGATAYWVAENNNPTESEQTFGQVALAPKTCGAYTDMSRKLLIQSSMDIEALVRTDLASVLARAIDLAAINGSGASNQPRGVLNTSGIGDVAGGTNGAAPTYAHMVELETDVSAANANVDNMALLTSPEMRGKLKQTQRFTSTDTPVWSELNFVNGYRAEVTNQVPKTLVKGTSSDCHAIIFGNWRDLIIGQWGALDVLVDPYTGGLAGTVRVRVLQDVDIAVRNAASFSAMKDARNI